MMVEPGLSFCQRLAFDHRRMAWCMKLQYVMSLHDRARENIQHGIIKVKPKDYCHNFSNFSVLCWWI